MLRKVMDSFAAWRNVWCSAAVICQGWYSNSKGDMCSVSKGKWHSFHYSLTLTGVNNISFLLRDQGGTVLFGGAVIRRCSSKHMQWALSSSFCHVGSRLGRLVRIFTYVENMLWMLPHPVLRFLLSLSLMHGSLLFLILVHILNVAKSCIFGGTGCLYSVSFLLSLLSFVSSFPMWLKIIQFCFHISIHLIFQFHHIS